MSDCVSVRLCVQTVCRCNCVFKLCVYRAFFQGENVESSSISLRCTESFDLSLPPAPVDSSGGSRCCCWWRCVRSLSVWALCVKRSACVALHILSCLLGKYYVLRYLDICSERTVKPRNRVVQHLYTFLSSSLIHL